MAAKRKRDKTKGISFQSGVLRRKKRPAAAGARPILVCILKVSVVICVLAGIGSGLLSLERRLERASAVSELTATAKLVNPPEWLNEALKEEVCSALTAFGEDLRPDEYAAESVQQNIESLISWVYDVKVRTTNDSLLIEAKWRKPLALVKAGFESFYLDAEMVVLDFVPMPHLPIVKVKVFSLVAEVPPAGS